MSIKGAFRGRVSVFFVLLAAFALPCIYLVYSRHAAANADPAAFPAGGYPVTPAGKLIVDTTTGKPAIAPLTMNLVRSPDAAGPDGKGRYMIAVNSGYGLEFTSRSKPQQTLSVIDLAPVDPVVVQDIYFPAPQSANFGLVFDPRAQPDGTYKLYVSGGFQNKIWTLTFDPRARQPVSPTSAPDKELDAPSIDVAGLTDEPPSTSYNDNKPVVYPTGLALSPDGETMYTANDLGDTLGIISNLSGQQKLQHILLKPSDSGVFVYPFDIRARSGPHGVSRIYVSLWGDGSVAAVDPNDPYRVTHITVGRHPTVMTLNHPQTRLYVVNSGSDTVSVIDTDKDRVIETINIRLAERELTGMGPEGLALSDDEKTLYVANAEANAVAVVDLAANPKAKLQAKLRGFIPTGNYASAVAVAGDRLIVANGKGTGVESSSNNVTTTGMYPNMPNKDFPPSKPNGRGMYPPVVVEGDLSVVSVPDEKQLYAYTQTVMQNDGLLGREKRDIFPGGRSPFKHVIYLIKENRSYDQVFGDIRTAGDGHAADGEPSVAIFGEGDAARSPAGEEQSITPNAHALARRFGLMDRFFVNAEASPDGHNWSTAAFSSDYVDKAFRWEYSHRGRSYDYEGFNHLPSLRPAWDAPSVSIAPMVTTPATGSDVGKFLKKYVPYLNGGRDIGEPETLYLWDDASRAGLSYRNYGEFVANVTDEDVDELNTKKTKNYPDLSKNATVFAVKRSLEGHFAPGYHNFDLKAPDIMTTDSYRAAHDGKNGGDAAITETNADEPFRGTTRFSVWDAEFRGYVADLQNGKGDHLPNLSIVRMPSDHTDGLSHGQPTPQFMVADNDYAVGRLVQEVSNSPYWADTAIFVVEDDAQDGPDHVDAHRSPALVISAYNRPGALVHEFNNTVSLIRTLELCLGLPPMNFLDANATPIDIFGAKPDLRPYNAVLPNVTLDNMMPPDRPNSRMAYFMRLTSEQDLTHADMADPQALNSIIWYSVRGDTEMPGIARLPAFDLMTEGLRPDDDDKPNSKGKDADD